MTATSSAPAPRVLIAAATFYRDIADHLVAGARAALEAEGAYVELAEAPGALEIPTAIRFAADHGGFDGFVALGCVIRGETTHYELVSNESARGLSWLGVARGLAIGNGILTVENRAQALTRADPAQKDKGGDAARAALALVALRKRFAPPARRDGSDDPFADPILLA